MRYELKSYNDFSFFLEVVKFGSGVTGLSPKISIKRFGAATYWTGALWGAYTEFTMTAVDAANQPGLYYYNFMPAIDTTVDTKYLVKMTDTPSLVTEYVSVTLNRFDNITTNNRVVPQNISDFMNAAVGFSLPLSTLGSVTLTATTTNVTNNVNANVVDWNGLGAAFTVDGSNYPQVAIYGGTIDANVVDWNGLGATLTLDGSSYPQVAMSGGTVDANVVDWNGTGATISKDATTNFPNVSSSISGTVNANVVEWGGLTPTLSLSGTGYPEVSMPSSTISDVASAVWEESITSHISSDTFGYLMQIIAGLTHYNHRVKDTQYDQYGRLTGCRIVVYSNAADAENDTNELTKIVVTSTYNSSNNMLSYLAVKE